MNLRFEAAWEIHQFLTAHKIPYAIIGGTALPRWGEPRFTKDVDLVTMIPLEEGAEPFARLVLGHFSERPDPRRPDPIAFARQKRMILIRASNGCDVDISLGVPGYEDEVMRRAVDFELEPGKVVRVCSAEDLIIHKCVAGRPQDLADVDGILIRQRDKIDSTYIRKWLGTLSELAMKPEIVDRFERAWQAVRRSTPRKARKPLQRPRRKK